MEKAVFAILSFALFCGCLGGTPQTATKTTNTVSTAAAYVSTTTTGSTTSSTAPTTTTTPTTTTVKHATTTAAPTTTMVPVPCDSTDPDMNLSIRGNVTGKNGLKSDMCVISEQYPNHDEVRKYFCNPDGSISSKDITCPYQCMGGICLDHPTNH